jgi:CubicO group peptidase (beta-lactamase class C family)
MVISCLLTALFLNVAPDDASPFPKAEAAAVGIDPVVLEKLTANAQAEESDAVVIIKDGKLIADWSHRQVGEKARSDERSVIRQRPDLAGGLAVFREDDNTRVRLNAIDEQLRKNSPAAPETGQGPLLAFSARGYLGQFLVVVPRHRIVAVRQRRRTDHDDPKDYTNEFGEFEAMIPTLIK